MLLILICTMEMMIIEWDLPRISCVNSKLSTPYITIVIQISEIPEINFTTSQHYLCISFAVCGWFPILDACRKDIVWSCNVIWSEFTVIPIKLTHSLLFWASCGLVLWYLINFKVWPVFCLCSCHDECKRFLKQYHVMTRHGGSKW